MIKQNTLVMIGDSALSKRLEGAAVKGRSAGFTVALYAEALSTAGTSHGERTYLGLSDIDISKFDVLIIPDGLVNPLRQDYDQLAVDTVRHFLVSGKSVALFDWRGSPSTEHLSDSRTYAS